jgi:heme oxygenase
MNATSTITIASNIIHEEESLDPRIFAVIDEISDDEAYQRIVSSISFWLDQQDVLLLASMLNTYFPPADRKRPPSTVCT